ncbi:hypothetical protein ALC56_12682 [Trachymyrmex septentrionalis]|uniref:Uncharacterized protein n=1 Tax=Trachymyrmex septentrionalis TaxID=34720 RepID=A0A195EXU4_9HYME|nr:hypothetical protein ALC56_12682 [Trachymyrmex septentrionalis]
MLSLEVTVIKANLRCVLSQPEALKKAWQRPPTDFTAYLRATEAYFKKRRLSCDLKFILDYGLLRISTTGCLPSEFLRVQLCFPRCFGRCIYRRKWKWDSRTTVMRIEQTRESRAQRRCRSSSLTPDNPTTKYTHLKCSLLFFFNDKC